MKKIKKEELENLQALNTELQKHGLCLKVEQLKKQFQEAEQGLMKTYGENAVVNLETGEVKEKEKDGENK